MWTDGRQVPRWQLAQLKQSEGELRLDLGSLDDYLRRNLRTARLLRHGKDVLPPLLDAAVLCIKSKTMSITGFERDNMRTYAQTWLIEIIQVDDQDGQTGSETPEKKAS